MAYTLNDNLKRWAEQYETAEFIQSDPVQIPHRYDSRVNIEISAFVTAWIAWGSRKQIIPKADFIDGKFSRVRRIITLLEPIRREPPRNGSNTKAVKSIFIERLHTPISTTFAPACLTYIVSLRTWKRHCKRNRAGVPVGTIATSFRRC